jgi:catechol 2,3-dioxygenase-like lactoylglutathione lyase family enzyme
VRGEDLRPKLIPELDVANLARSLEFYVDLIGFRIVYQRPEERFAFLDLDGAALMLEEAAGPGRRFVTVPLEHPFGRGVNFQIEVADADALCARLGGAGHPLFLPLEERWYRRGAQEVGNRQFVAKDPDGYLLRFFTDLGERRIDPTR